MIASGSGSKLAFVFKATFAVGARMSSTTDVVVVGSDLDPRLLKELEEFERWYTASTIRWSALLFILRTTAILSGFLVALLTGLTVGHTTNQDAIKYSAIVISALGALAATILTQYRVGEIERLRANGRIACQRLRQEAIFIFPRFSEADRSTFVTEMIDKLERLENEQNDGFYKHFSGRTDQSAAN